MTGKPEVIVSSVGFGTDKRAWSRAFPPHLLILELWRHVDFTGLILPWKQDSFRIADLHVSLYEKWRSVYPPALLGTLLILIGNLPLSSGSAFCAWRGGQAFEYHCCVGGPVGR